MASNYDPVLRYKPTMRQLDVPPFTSILVKNYVGSCPFASAPGFEGRQDPIYPVLQGSYIICILPSSLDRSVKPKKSFSGCADLLKEVFFITTESTNSNCWITSDESRHRPVSCLHQWVLLVPGMDNVQKEEHLLSSSTLKVTEWINLTLTYFTVRPFQLFPPVFLT